MTGVLAVRDNHISLFLADSSLHQQGIGRALFHHFLADRGLGTVSANSSPHAVEVYRHLGFRPTAPEQMTDGIRYTPMRYSQWAESAVFRLPSHGLIISQLVKTVPLFRFRR